MTSFNSKNEKLKWFYVRHLAEVKGRKSQTTNAVEDSLLRFEEATGFGDFVAFDREQAQAYKETLRGRQNARTKQELCASSVVSELIRVRSFFQWLLSECPKDVKYRFSDTEYLNPSKAEVAKAQRSTGKKHIPSISQVRHVLRAMPAATPDAPVFPKSSTKSVPGTGFVNAGLSHGFYKSSTPLAASVSAGFENAGLPRSTCHRFRDMLIQMGKDERWPVELMVCLSAAVGHNDLSVTLSSYAHPTDEKLISVFKELREKK